MTSFCRLGLAAFIVVAGIGCSKSNDIFPLKVGSEWRYSAKNHLGQFLHSVKVTREIPTSVGLGYELRGALGDSILAWDGAILRASVLAGTRFNPPIRLLNASGKTATLTWKGKAYAGGKTVDASAVVTQGEGEWNSDMRRKATKTTMVLTMPDKTLTIETLYVAGIGPVSQSQRETTGGISDFELSMEHISGP